MKTVKWILTNAIRVLSDVEWEDYNMGAGTIFIPSVLGKDIRFAYPGERIGSLCQTQGGQFIVMADVFLGDRIDP